MKRVLKKLIRLFLGLFILFQIYFMIRLYWLTSCAIPTNSMTPTLLGGDYIFTSMQIPGRRIFEEDPLYPGRYQVHRKKGIREVMKGDVLVFNYPYSTDQNKMILSNKEHYCKRCVALPGEWYQWMMDSEMKELYIPKANDTIELDTSNYENYYKCIEYETGSTMSRSQDGRIYLADTLLASYCFRHNYYFMRGDNAGDSYDSRYWGILPDDFILGVGQCIWFSREKDSHRIRWNRMFKKII